MPDTQNTYKVQFDKFYSNIYKSTNTMRDFNDLSQELIEQ